MRRLSHILRLMDFGLILLRAIKRLFLKTYKGDSMKTFWEFVTFILLGVTLGYMFAVALLGV